MRHRRRYRNPMSLSGVKGVIVPAAIGAAGGLALDIVWSYASPYIPSALTSSPMIAGLTKLAAAFGIGLAARKVLGPVKGNAVMAGAVTVQLYSLLSTQLAGTLPGLSGFRGMGAYMTPMAGLGNMSPAQYIQKPARMAGMGRVGAYMTPMSGLAGLPFGGLGDLSGRTDDNA
jgi:hypothetical protein